MLCLMRKVSLFGVAKCQTCKGTHGLLRSQVAARHQHGLDCFVQEGGRGVHCSLQAVLVADLETQRALVSILFCQRSDPAGQI